MLRSIFGYDQATVERMADTVDREGRVIVKTTTMEHAELKRDQILAYGADPRMGKSEGSMYSDIEPEG